jgi:hypothetical protein
MDHVGEEKGEASPLDAYQEALDIAEAHIKLLSQKPLEEALSELSDFEQAKYRTTLAYAVGTLQLCYLRTKGESIEGHPNMRGLERLRTYFYKLDRFVDLAAP